MTTPHYLSPMYERNTIGSPQFNADIFNSITKHRQIYQKWCTHTTVEIKQKYRKCSAKIQRYRGLLVAILRLFAAILYCFATLRGGLCRRDTASLSIAILLCCLSSPRCPWPDCQCAQPDGAIFC